MSSPEFPESGDEMKNGPEDENIVVFDLLGGGQGDISLVRRLDSGDITSETLGTVTEQLSDNTWEDEVSEDDVREVTKCGDGRFSFNPIKGLQRFGGTAGLIKSFITGGLEAGKNAAEDIAEKVKDRTIKGKKSGGHTANTHGGEGCGCGECDGAEAAVTFMTENPDAVKGVVDMLYDVLDVKKRYKFGPSTEVFEARLDRYSELNEKSYFANGAAQVQAVEDNTPEDEKSVEHLEGGHGEIVWVFNLRRDTKFKREEFVKYWEDQNIGVFWEDQWGIEDELRETATDEVTGEVDEELFQNLFMSDIMGRVATAGNLTAADVRVIVRK